MNYLPLYSSNISSSYTCSRVLEIVSIDCKGQTFKKRIPYLPPKRQGFERIRGLKDNAGYQVYVIFPQSCLSFRQQLSYIDQFNFRLQMPLLWRVFNIDQQRIEPFLYQI